MQLSGLWWSPDGSLGASAELLLCAEADGLGSCHQPQLVVLTSSLSGSVTVCGCSSVASLQKGGPGRGGRGEDRISPTRCVSTMLICHPLNLYCSSTGSISHIAKTLVWTWNKSWSKNKDGTPKTLGEESCNFRCAPVQVLLQSTIHLSTLFFGICI